MADTMVEDDLIYPLLMDLAQCVCQEMTSRGFEDMCFCGVQPGEAVLADYIGESGKMAWVRLDSVQPVEDEVIPSGTAGCYLGVNAVIEVGHAACAPIPDGRGLLSEAEQLNTTRIQTAMMQAAHQAITCCKWAGYNSVDVQGWTPFGPQGGAVGGAWSIMVTVD